MEKTTVLILVKDKKLEFLYTEGKGYLFLDITSLDQVLVDSSIIGKKSNYLKEGTDIKASFCGESVISVELPQYLELMVAYVESERDEGKSVKMAQLETGAKIEVPPFIEVGDIIKVDTRIEEYIQRV